MNVCIFIYRYSLGGVETFATTLARGLKKYHGVNAHIYVMIPESVKEYAEKAAASDVPVYTAYTSRLVIVGANLLARLVGFFSRYPLRQRILYARFKRHLRKHAVDVVHSNYHLCDEFAHFASLEMGIPYVVTDHGSYRTPEVYENKVRMMQQVASSSSAFIYLTKESLANFTEAGITFNSTCRVLRIWNGWEPSIDFDTSIIPDKSSPFVFGMIARGEPSKGWQIVIDAFIELSKLLPEANVRLILTGDGEYLEQLKNKYLECEAIEFTGPSFTPEFTISSYHVGLLLSSFPAESMPYTIIQYLAQGKPCIISDIGATREMISAGKESAGVVLSFDKDGSFNNSELVNAFRQLYEERAHYLRWSTLAHLAFEKFKVDAFASAYFKTYKHILHK